MSHQGAPPTVYLYMTVNPSESIMPLFRVSMTLHLHLMEQFEKHFKTKRII